MARSIATKTCLRRLQSVALVVLFGAASASAQSVSDENTSAARAADSVQRDRISMHAGNPLCGVYAVAFTLEVLGHSAPIEDIAVPEYLDSSEGSSARSVVEALHDHGCSTIIYSDLGANDLYRLESPAILYLDNFDGITAPGHWVVFLGIRDGRIALFDPPPSTLSVTPVQLLERWSGIAIEARSRDQTRSSSMDTAWILTRKIAVPLSVALLLVVTLTLLKKLRTAKLGAIFSKGSVQIAAIALGSFFASRVYSAISALDLYEIQQTDMVSYHVRRSLDNLKRLSHQDMASLSGSVAAGRGGAVIVDARPAKDFRAGSIPGAINIPIDSIRHADIYSLKSTSNDTQIVLYCSNKDCAYADNLAVIMSYMGVSNLTIYPGGWEEWFEHQ